jgi:ribosome-binding protein aMBF1 (putative translation factor)
MEDQTPQADAETTATPQTGMPPEEEASTTTVANPEPSTPEAQDQSDPLAILKEAGINKYSTREEAIEGLKNLNKLVGDQTVAQQRKVTEALVEQTGLSPEELAEYLAQGNVAVNQPETATAQPQISRETKIALERSTKVLVRDFIREKPEAKPLQDAILQKALVSGKDPEQIWAEEYEPIFKAGTASGGKKLQQTIEGQPAKATSTASEPDTRLDFKKMTSEEMRKHLPVTQR